MKETFMHNEIWLLTTMGGFQRSNLYNKKVKNKEEDRKKFKEALHHKIREIAFTQYTRSVSESRHIANISSISQYTAKCKYSNLLYNGRLNFGVCQKLLNLYLKYLWCIYAIKTPPHFPVDRIIQENLNREAAALGLAKREVTAWTQMQNERDYMEVINHAKTVLKKSTFKNLAELELYLFERVM